MGGRMREGRRMERSHGIEVEDLVRVFRKGPRAVDGVSFSASPGEVYGFPGPKRSFIAGVPTGVATAFITGVSLVAIFLVWAYLGLRSAERSG